MIGLSIVGAGGRVGVMLEVGKLVVAGAVVASATIGPATFVAVAATTLGAVSAYGSMGRISPEGPPYGVPTSRSAYGSIGVIGPDGPVDKARGGDGLGLGAKNIDASGDELATEPVVAAAPARAVEVDCFGRRGGTSQRPAA